MSNPAVTRAPGDLDQANPRVHFMTGSSANTGFWSELSAADEVTWPRALLRGSRGRPRRLGRPEFGSVIDFPNPRGGSATGVVCGRCALRSVKSRPRLVNSSRQSNSLHRGVVCITGASPRSSPSKTLTSWSCHA
jgi:hypothetical protein